MSWICIFFTHYPVAVSEDAVSTVKTDQTNVESTELSKPQAIINSIPESERKQLLEEAMAEVEEESFSLAKSFQRRSGSYYSVFKRATQNEVQNGAARLKFENSVIRFEGKLIQLAISKSTDTEEIKALKCVHYLGDFTRPSEIAQIIQASGCRSPKTPVCDATSRFRTIDGTCNNLRKPLQGGTDTPFRRLLPAYYEDGVEVPKGRAQANGCLKSFCNGPFSAPVPSARLASSLIVGDDQVSTEKPFTHMVMQWGQFLDHDLDFAVEMPHEEACESCSIVDDCEPIHIPPGDKVFGGGKGSTKDGKCINFRRSVPVCTTSSRLEPREQINGPTSYLDGSQIYGSTQKRNRRVRKTNSPKGLLKSPNRLLPLTFVQEECGPVPHGGKGCFLAGDGRVNEQVGLTTMHTLFVLEHNRIARRLKRINPRWSGERVYQEARKIVGAVLQKITYEDYLPKVIGPNTFKTVVRPHSGYKDNVDATIPNSFATAAYRYGHSLINPTFDRYTTNRYERGPNKKLNLLDSFFSMAVFRQTDIGAVLRGLVTQFALRNDENVNSVLTNQLFRMQLDLGALNVQRGRDHGLPVYGAWTSYCRTLFPTLPRAEIRSEKTFWRFFNAYGSPEVSDLFLAGLAEKRIPDSLLGPTFACIFGETFSNLRDGDRFFYEHKGVFTPAQLREIRKATLSRIICDNTSVRKIQRDAFRFDGANTRVRCWSLPSMNLNKWKCW